jgi:hypothetical protein
MNNLPPDPILDEIQVILLSYDRLNGRQRPFPHAVQDLVLHYPQPLTRAEAARAMVRLGYCLNSVDPAATAAVQIARAIRTRVLGVTEDNKHLTAGIRHASQVRIGAPKTRP